MERKPDLPSLEDLGRVVEWLAGGQRGLWSRDYWESFITRAYPWAYKTTRGLLLALKWIAVLEQRIVVLERELRQARAQLGIVPVSSPIPILPPIPHPRQSSGPPPPPSAEAQALSTRARPPFDEVQLLRRRRFMEKAEELFREISNYEPIDEPSIESETVFEPTDES